MRITERAKEIIELNMADHYIPFAVHGGGGRIYPMYYARILGESTLVFPVTGATGIDDALKEASPASVLVADRQGGYEAYLLAGKARYVTEELDFQLVAEMRNVAPGFPIHGAVVFEVEEVRLSPPP